MEIQVHKNEAQHPELAALFTLGSKDMLLINRQCRAKKNLGICAEQYEFLMHVLHIIIMPVCFSLIRFFVKRWLTEISAVCSLNYS